MLSRSDAGPVEDKENGNAYSRAGERQLGAGVSLATGHEAVEDQCQEEQGQGDDRLHGERLLKDPLHDILAHVGARRADVATQPGK